MSEGLANASPSRSRHLHEIRTDQKRSDPIYGNIRGETQMTEAVAIVETISMEDELGEATVSAVSWAAIVAGGLASATLTLVLLAFGTGMGFSVVSPWSSSGGAGSTSIL